MVSDRNSGLLLLLAFALAISTAGNLKVAVAVAGVLGATDVGRTSFELEGDVAWVVQISDLHLSAYHRDRASDLAARLPAAINAIRPHLILLTGDLTDAKNKRGTSTRQDESEWLTYKETIDAVIEQTGYDKARVFDIRGNHDKYGVPYVGDGLDFFSTYSISAQLGRLQTIKSISLLGDNRNYVFMSIDDTMSNGIRYPSNLFGHPSDEMLLAVDSELQFWNNHSTAPATKIVFGHFPLSFTASSAKGQLYENVFGKHSISAYICGHLHATFGRQLWSLHSVEVSSDLAEPKTTQSFWEWEVGDWKNHRLMRILAIDKGAVSFKDIVLQRNFRTVILITYPLDSRNMNHPTSSHVSARNDINALIFSTENILNVTARVFDSFRKFKIVDEIPLKQISGFSSHKPLFHAKWDAGSYMSTSPNRYWLQVFVVDSLGKESASERRPFSVQGGMAAPSCSFMAPLLLGTRIERLYKIFLWINLGFLFVLLSVPKLLQLYTQRSPSYRRWSTSTSSSPLRPARNYFWVVWFLTEGSRSKMFWISSVVYLLWLFNMPWFWGHATSENGQITQMYLWGWTVSTPASPHLVDGQAFPDIMAITIPFLYLVVAPMMIILYCLFAERAALCSRYVIMQSSDDYSATEGVVGNQLYSWIHKIAASIRMFCGGWTRRGILLASALIILVHVKLCSILMLAYGAGPVAISPAVSWVPLLVLITAAYVTSITSYFTGLG